MVKYKSLPLEGKVSCEATRMRWKRITIAFEIYTSPPPTAEPLLKEKPLKGLHLNLMCRNMDNVEFWQLCKPSP